MFRGIAKQVSMAIKRKRTAAKKRAIRLATRKVARPISTGTETPRSISTSSVFSLRETTSSVEAGYRISDINGDLIWSDVTTGRPFVRLTVRNRGGYAPSTIQSYNNGASVYSQGPIYSLTATLADGRTEYLYVKGTTIYFGRQGVTSDLLEVGFTSSKGAGKVIEAGETIGMQISNNTQGGLYTTAVRHTLGQPLTTSSSATGTSFTVNLEVMQPIGTFVSGTRVHMNSQYGRMTLNGARNLAYKNPLQTLTDVFTLTFDDTSLRQNTKVTIKPSGQANIGKVKVNNNCDTLVAGGSSELWFQFGGSGDAYVLEGSKYEVTGQGNDWWTTCDECDLCQHSAPVAYMSKAKYTRLNVWLTRA